MLSTLKCKEILHIHQDTSDKLNTTAVNETSNSDCSVEIQTCSICGVNFRSLEDKRDHTKSDFHYYNLKQNIHGRKIVTENQFEEIIGGNNTFKNSVHLIDIFKTSMKVYLALILTILKTKRAKIHQKKQH